MKFSDYLIKNKEKKGLTISDLVYKLSIFDPDDFKTLSEVTFSRWGGGHHDPTDARKKKIITFFGDNVVDFFPFKSSSNEVKTKEDIINYILNEKILDRRHNKLIGSFSYPKNHSDIELFDITTLASEEDINLILNFYYSTHSSDGFLKNINYRDLSKLGVNYLCKVHGSYFGHFSSFLLKNNVFWDILNGKKRECDITPDDLANENDPNACLYLYSFYGHNRIVISLVMQEFYKYLVKNKNKIKYLGSILVTREGVMIMRRIGLEQYKKISNNYSYFSRPCDILSSKDVDYFS